MSGGGGKGGSKKTETTIPEWVRAPADRNLQRAEAVQQIKYMPYTGGQVAALNPNQTQAMQNNANTAAAFGLLAPTDATAGMPTPTTYANGMQGYGSIGLYDQALKELTARDPANMNAYDALFGNAVPANTPPSLNRGGGGGVNFNFGGQKPAYNPYNPNTWSTKDRVAHERQVSPNSTNSQLESAYGQKSTYVPKQKDIAQQRKAIKRDRAKTSNFTKTKLGGSY